MVLLFGNVALISCRFKNTAIGFIRDRQLFRFPGRLQPKILGGHGGQRESERLALLIDPAGEGVIVPGSHVLGRFHCSAGSGSNIRHGGAAILIEDDLILFGCPCGGQFELLSRHGLRQSRPAGKVIAGPGRLGQDILRQFGTKGNRPVLHPAAAGLVKVDQVLFGSPNRFDHNILCRHCLRYFGRPLLKLIARFDRGCGLFGPCSVIWG